ncbi:MFS general substrate transporter [Xylariomycetidae sp. FL2044]|nr:MFS general substrate transporter [Xylariomycetidae sp. FL2044]
MASSAGEKRDGATPSTVPNEGLASGAVRQRKPLRFYMAFLSLFLMVLVVSLDSTSLSVAIPVITRELDGTSLDGFWANLTFLLAVVVTQPLYVSASDIIGRKPLLNSAFLLFTVGSVIFATARSMPVIIVGRTIQGLGGGGLDVLNEVLVSQHSEQAFLICDITTLKERPLWLGLLSIPLAIGCILGPILGALFIEFVTWRWIGWINLPLVGVSFALAAYGIRLTPIDGSLMSRVRRLDWIGMLLFTVGSTIFALPLSWGGSLYPWSSFRTILPLVLGVVILFIFGVYEATPAEPVIPYRLFHSRTSIATLFGGLLHGLILYPLLLYVPLFFQAVYLQDPLQAAISMLPLYAVMIAFTAISGLTIEHLRHYRWQLWVGWATIAVGEGLFAIWDTSFSRAEIAGFQVIAAIGLGVHFVVSSIAMQASAPRVEDQGLAVGTLVSFRLFGALIGLAAASTLFNNAFTHAISSLGPLPEPVAVLSNAANAIGFIPNLRDADISAELSDAIRMAYAGAMRNIWYFLVAAAGVGLLTSFLIQNLSIENEEVGKQHMEMSSSAEKETSV